MMKYYLAKTKLNKIKVAISKSLNDSYITPINHAEFVLINNVLKDYDEITEKNRNPNKT